MKTKKNIVILFLLILSTVVSLRAQQPPSTRDEALRRLGIPQPSAESASKPAIYYRLDLVISEMDGAKTVDTRNYSLWVQSGVTENMTAGSEVPYYSGSFTKTDSGTTKNVSYRSIGVSIYCTVNEGDEGPRLDLRLDISDAPPPEKETDSPVFRKININSMALLVPDKQTRVGMVEDPGSRHRFLVDVTATRIN